MQLCITFYRNCVRPKAVLFFFFVIKQYIMKKIWITATFIAFSTIAMAQQDEQQPNDDQLQQQPPSESQKQVERAARIDAVKQTSNEQVAAEKEAKDKAQSQKQTKAQPVGLNPTEASPKKAKRTN